MKELMELVKDGKIDPVPVESKPVNEINGILDDLKNGKVPGLVSISHN
jgi:D-arabinose 1-dehydrogenase-like Zn-dependent alcohol dehydrogenase